MPLGSMLQARKKTPALRGAAFLARTNAVHAPSLQPTNDLYDAKIRVLGERSAALIHSGLLK